MLLFNEVELGDEEEGYEAVLKSLRKVALYGYDVSVFARRLAWFPLNFPCHLDGGVVFPAEEILTSTTDDPQVLTGYWVALDDLVVLFGLVDTNTADFAFFRTPSFSLIGSLNFFEGLFVEQAILTDEAHPWTSIEVETKIPQRVDSDRYMVVESSLGKSSKIFLNDEGLSLARPLPLLSTDAVIRQANLGVSPEKLELKELFDVALRERSIVAFSEDAFRHGKMGCYSVTWTIDHLRDDLDAYLSTPFGSFFFYDEDWNLRIAAIKRASESKWNVMQMPKRN